MEGFETFKTQLDNFGLSPRTLGVTDSATKAPLDEVIQILSSCRGAIVLGYPQLQISSGFIKEVPVSADIELATEWNHIEAALAYANGIPLLVIHHNTISRGIFDRGVLNAFIYDLDLASPNWSMQAGINGAIKKWKEECSNTYIAARLPSGDAEEGLSVGKPLCPNCSINGNKVYLRPVPTDFVEIQGGERECSTCGYIE